MNCIIDVNMNLVTTFKYSVLESFSKEKILKSLKKFGIVITESELNELIMKHCSLTEVMNIIIERFNPKPIVVSNLQRFIGKYWELTVPEKWSAEEIIDTMNGLRLPLEPEEYMMYFKYYCDLFKHIKEIDEPLRKSKNSDLKNQYEKSLMYWEPKFINLYQEMNRYPGDAWDIFLELCDFLKKNQKMSDALNYTKELYFIKARMLYLSQKRMEAFEFLDKEPEVEVSATEILMEKLDLLLDDSYDSSLAEGLYSEIKKLLNTKNNTLEEAEINEILYHLRKFRQIEEVNTDELSVLINRLQSLLTTDEGSTYLDDNGTNEEKLDKGENGFLGEDENDDEFDKEAFIDTEYNDGEYDEDDENDDFINDDDFIDDDEDEEDDGLLNDILFSQEPIPISFECVTCGLEYEQEVGQLYIPYNWKELLEENQTKEENGILFFNCEIICPICSSFKFFVTIRSKLLVISLIDYISDNAEDLDYDPSNEDNSVIIGKFVSKFVKESKSIRETITNLKELLKEELENEELMESVGNYLLWMNDYTEALKVFKKMVEQNNKKVEAWFNIAKIYYNRKNVKQLDKVVDKVIEIIEDDRRIFKPNINYLVYIDEMAHELKSLKSIKRLKKLFHKFENTIL